MDIFFFRHLLLPPSIIYVHRRTLSSLSHSRSLFLSFFLSSLSLSLSLSPLTTTTSQRIKFCLQEQNNKEQNKTPKRKNETATFEEDLSARFFEQIDFLPSFLPMAFRPTPPQNPKKKKTMLTRIPPATWLQIAPRLPFPKPHHTNKSTPFFASPIQSVKKSTTTFSQYLSPFFLPAHILLHNQNPF
jgi:hypothetical protein